MPDTAPSSPGQAPTVPAPSALWKRVQEPEHPDVVYAFKEDFSFASALLDTDQAEAVLRQYGQMINEVVQHSVVNLETLELPGQVTLHLDPTSNFAIEAFDAIYDILSGVRYYAPYMSPTLAPNGFGERMVIVRLSGVVMREGERYEASFATSVFACEYNAKTDQHMIVHALDKKDDDESSSEPTARAVPVPLQGGTISTTLGDHHDAPPANTAVSFLPPAADEA